MSRLIVFTDLDGTLLEPSSVRWEAAQPALRRLRGRGIPVVLCTGMTRAQVLPIWQELGLRDPFVCESGGAVYIPRNYFPFALPRARVEAGFQVLELGVRHQRLVQALDAAAKTSGVQTCGFSRMNDKRVAELTGLNRTWAKRARRREYDEPFLLERGTTKQKERFFRWLQQRGLRWREEGSVYHLMGDNDEGLAVGRLIELYRQQYGEIQTVGLGDSPNDVDFLAVVDSPVLVAGPDGNHDWNVRTRVPGIRLAPGAGPVGWNGAMLEILGAAS